MGMIEINKQVLNAMGDDISRKIYQNWIEYSNGTNEAMESIIRSVMQGEELLGYMESHRDNLYIFGAGMLGQDFVDTWKWKFEFRAFIDNDGQKQGKHIKDLPVISLEEIKGRRDAAVIIINKFYSDDIERQLGENDFDENHIFNLGGVYRQLNKKQYFDLEYLTYEDKEKFVDCGVLDGETSLNFLEICSARVKNIWMFEPDKKNVQKVRKNFEGKEVDYQIIQKGVWSSAATLKFNSLGNGCAGIDENGEDCIETISLDDALLGSKPTFIKMDIEGAELEALKGAEQIIRRCRPKLAISVYHKLEDIDEIPKLLLAYHPNYRFYLRHYSLMSSETILYAL